MTFNEPKQIALLHGAGYVGGELLRLLLAHPHATPAAVTSRTFAGEPVWRAHPALRGQTDLCFTDPEALDLNEIASGIDALLVAAEHGQSAHLLPSLLKDGFTGAIVDLSADFRYSDASAYETWFDYTHPAPAWLDRFTYGLPEAAAPYAPGTRLIANPGCFATGLALALRPPAQHIDALSASVTALTGASGSGTRPTPATHYPSRDGNVRAYKVLAHRHAAEIRQVVGPNATYHFVPASGPWTRGIWGTAHVALPPSVKVADVTRWYEAAYADAPLVRLTPGRLPELAPVVRTPFCDLGWVVQEDPAHPGNAHLVVGFALDNLLKGAAAQAIQNLNLLLDLPETAGLLPACKSAFADSTTDVRTPVNTI